MNLNCSLINRTILEVCGEDSTSFLQGLITQDIKLLNDKNSIYTLLLTNNGRFFLDFFITQKDSSLLIDINTNHVELFRKTINYYKLRSKVEFKVNDQLKVYTVFNSQPIHYANSGLQENTVNIDDNIILIDPRLPNLGLRIITNNHDFLNNNIVRKYIGDYFNIDPTEIKKTTYTDYITFRYKYSVPESTELIQEKSIPLECNFEELNALSFSKGCYLGQEFTNASKRIMVTRKKLITMKIKNYNPNSNYDFLKLQPLVNKHGEKVGKILSIHNRYIFTLIKIDYLKAEKISFVSNNEELFPILPSWLTKILKIS